MNIDYPVSLPLKVYGYAPVISCLVLPGVQQIIELIKTFNSPNVASCTCFVRLQGRLQWMYSPVKKRKETNQLQRLWSRV
jgi:hypothetical protein